MRYKLSQLPPAHPLRRNGCASSRNRINDTSDIVGKRPVYKHKRETAGGERNGVSNDQHTVQSKSVTERRSSLAYSTSAPCCSGKYRRSFATNPLRRYIKPTRASNARKRTTTPIIRRIRRGAAPRPSGMTERVRPALLAPGPCTDTPRSTYPIRAHSRNRCGKPLRSRSCRTR